MRYGKCVWPASVPQYTLTHSTAHARHSLSQPSYKIHGVKMCVNVCVCRKPLVLAGNSSSSSTSQYVKQELRAICSARSQSQQALPMSAPPQVSQQQQQQPPSQQPLMSMPSVVPQPQSLTQHHHNAMLVDFDGGLPADILESSRCYSLRPQCSDNSPVALA